MSKTLCRLQQAWDLPGPLVLSCEKNSASLTIVMSIIIQGIQSGEYLF